MSSSSSMSDSPKSSPALHFTSPALTNMTRSAIRPISEAATSSAGSSSGRAGGNGMKQFLRTPVMAAVLPFANGGIAGIVATCVIQPIDMIKVRIQLAPSSQSALDTTRATIANGGVSGLYKGLSAGILRQAVYTTARLGFFDTFMGKLKVRAEANGSKIGFAERAGAGLAAGGIGAFLGNPADLALIRMQSDGLKPIAERANYRSVFHTLTSIYRAEGVPALWTGATPTIVRAMCLNFGQLAFFSEAKAQLKTYEKAGYHAMNATSQTLLASAIAGFFASAMSLPPDMLKTRMQKQAKVEGVKPLSMAAMAAKIVREEGLGRFYKGFGTYYLRIAPHAMVTLLVADYLGLITK